MYLLVYRSQILDPVVRWDMQGSIENVLDELQAKPSRSRRTVIAR